MKMISIAIAMLVMAGCAHVVAPGTPVPVEIVCPLTDKDGVTPIDDLVHIEVQIRGDDVVRTVALVELPEELRDGRDANGDPAILNLTLDTATWEHGPKFRIYVRAGDHCEVPGPNWGDWLVTVDDGTTTETVIEVDADGPGTVTRSVVTWPSGE